MSLPEIQKGIVRDEALRAAQEERATSFLEKQKLIVLGEANAALHQHPIFKEIVDIATSDKFWITLRDIWEGWNVETEIPGQVIPKTLPIIGEVGTKVIPARWERVPFEPEFDFPRVDAQDIPGGLTLQSARDISEKDISEIVESVLTRPTVLIRLKGNVHHTHERIADFDEGPQLIMKELTVAVYADRPISTQEPRLEISINNKFAVYSLDELLHALADLSRRGQHPDGGDMLYEECLVCNGVDSHLSKNGFIGFDQYTKGRILQLKKEKEEKR